MTYEEVAASGINYFYIFGLKLSYNNIDFFLKKQIFYKLCVNNLEYTLGV